MSKPSKSERKEERIQTLEKENSNLKKKNAELTRKTTVSLDEEQMEHFLNELTEHIEWSTNRIVDETPKNVTVFQSDKANQGGDGFAYFIKWIIAIPFFLVAVAVIYLIYSNGSTYWNVDWVHKLALIVMGILAFDSACLGVEILKEKDRNYVISLFSALVALVALIVSLVK